MNMDVITYSLRVGQPDAVQYYQEVAALADEVTAEAESRFDDLLDGCLAYHDAAGSQVEYTRLECIFELLILGVLWKVYLPNALALRAWESLLLTGLVRVREKGGRQKKVADLLRRVSNTMLFSRRRALTPTASPRMNQMESLLRWLASTGDYSAQVRRLRSLQAYLSALAGSQSFSLVKILDFAEWFDQRSQQVLGSYTCGVERFLTEDHPNHFWHEDIIFTGRPRVEYHLNMVGDELLNRAYRQNFLAVDRKVVIVPPCMRLRGEEGCRAVSTPFGSKCAACDPACRVNRLAQLGAERGFAVLILGELEIYSPRESVASENGNTGIVGVSCVLTNAPGGWDARRMGIPAQGVPLDYCGCTYHWHDPGIPTDVDFARIVDTVGVKGGLE
jgi:hypothetical protein